MAYQIGYIILAAAISGICYRLGGQGKPYNGKVRDWGCPLVFLGLIFLLFGFKIEFWREYLSTFILSWFALSTYWDWLFGYDSYWMHGLGCGLAGIPLIWADVPLWIILARLTLCTIGMGLWSKFIKRDVPQECGRGGIFII